MTYSAVKFAGCTTVLREKTDRTQQFMNHRCIDSLIEQLENLQVCIAQLETAAPELRTDSTTVRAAAPRFNRGDRVWIKNKLKKPATWSNGVAWNENKAKTATVSHIYKGQVHFVTDNGVKTWRAVNNLKRID